MSAGSGVDIVSRSERLLLLLEQRREGSGEGEAHPGVSDSCKAGAE